TPSFDPQIPGRAHRAHATGDPQPERSPPTSYRSPVRPALLPLAATRECRTLRSVPPSSPTHLRETPVAVPFLETRAAEDCAASECRFPRSCGRLSTQAPFLLQSIFSSAELPPPLPRRHRERDPDRQDH